MRTSPLILARVINTRSRQIRSVGMAAPSPGSSLFSHRLIDVFSFFVPCKREMFIWYFTLWRLCAGRCHCISSVAMGFTLRLGRHNWDPKSRTIAWYERETSGQWSGRRWEPHWCYRCLSAFFPQSPRCIKYIYIYIVLTITDWPEGDGDWKWP